VGEVLAGLGEVRGSQYVRVCKQIRVWHRSVASDPDRSGSSVAGPNDVTFPVVTNVDGFRDGYVPRSAITLNAFASGLAYPMRQDGKWSTTQGDSRSRRWPTSASTHVTFDRVTSVALRCIVFRASVVPGIRVNGVGDRWRGKDSSGIRRASHTVVITLGVISGWVCRVCRMMRRACLASSGDAAARTPARVGPSARPKVPPTSRVTRILLIACASRYPTKPR
jgi:hypothetical protein